MQDWRGMTICFSQMVFCIMWIDLEKKSHNFSGQSVGVTYTASRKFQIRC